MEEKRSEKRLELDAHLVVKRLDDNSDEPHKTTITVTDMSKNGIGFNCSVPLTIGAIYEAYLTIWTKEVLHVFINISRVDKIGKFDYACGGTFIGMSQNDANRIAIYDTVQS